MSTKRRGAAAASPDVRLRGQKRRKVSEESPVSPDEAEQSPSREASEAAEEAEEEGDSAAPEDEQEPEEDFEGDTLQAAQDKIMTELTRLKDDDGEDVAYPFIGKPDRNLYRDYYEIIQHPTSLRTIQKQVRGTDSRKNPTRTTAFPTWKSFEDEVAYIWRNAREYNEDGSDISTLAGILEKHFKRRVAEAKKHVPDPIQTSETPFKDDETPSGVTGDGDAVKRQPDTTRTTSASQEADTHRISPRYRSLRRHLASPSKSSAATTPSVAEQPSAASATAQDGPSVVKSESAGQVPPPSETAGAPNGLHSVPSEPQETPAPTPAPPPAPVSPLDSVLRRPGQDASSALIRNVHISTHPSLALQRSFSLDIPPSDTFSQQSVTINLPASHNLLTIRPKVLPGNAQRHVKMIALVGVQRLHPSTNDPSGLAYDLPLPPGTTKIDLEAIAGPARGVPKTGPPGTEIDYERVTIFVNLLR